MAARTLSCGGGGGAEGGETGIGRAGSDASTRSFRRDDSAPTSEECFTQLYGGANTVPSRTVSNPEEKDGFRRRASTDKGRAIFDDFFGGHVSEAPVASAVRSSEKTTDSASKATADRSSDKTNDVANDVASAARSSQSTNQEPSGSTSKGGGGARAGGIARGSNESAKKLLEEYQKRQLLYLPAAFLPGASVDEVSVRAREHAHERRESTMRECKRSKEHERWINVEALIV